MLIDFEIKNYASIKNTMLLSAETGERLSRLKTTNTIQENNFSLLKNLLIFGPNGSGKSNLINGLRCMQKMILNDPAKITTPLPFQPFKLDQASQQAPTQFAVRFNDHHHTYDYRFSFNEHQIITEQLTCILKTTEQVYFKRQAQSFSVLPQNLKAVAQATKENSLLLFTAQQANDPHAINVLRWFQNDLIFVDDTDLSDNTDLSELLQDTATKQEFLNFLRFADFNIVDVRIRDVALHYPAELKQTLAQLNPNFNLETSQKKLYTVHTQYNDAGQPTGEVELPLDWESRGTQKIFVIALCLIFAQRHGNGKTLLFDEFDDSLHYELSSALIQIFNSKMNLNQFILTTHELQLLDCDVRVDQLYLVEKDFTGISTLKSIFDFNESRGNARAGISFMKKYLAGKFGAMPQIDVSEMLTALTPQGAEKSHGAQVP
jgi:AAA15 family ATPase/GTPase